MHLIVLCSFSIVTFCGFIVGNFSINGLVNKHPANVLEKILKKEARRIVMG